MTYRTLLAAGTALFALNLSLAQAAGPVPSPVTEAASPSLLMAQANPDELTREERRKLRRQQQEEQNQQAPAATPEPRKTQPEVQEPRRNRQNQTERQERRREERAQDGQPRRKTVETPAETPEAATPPKPKKAEQQRQEKRKQAEETKPKRQQAEEAKPKRQQAEETKPEVKEPATNGQATTPEAQQPDRPQRADDANRRKGDKQGETAPQTTDQAAPGAEEQPKAETDRDGKPRRAEGNNRRNGNQTGEDAGQAEAPKDGTGTQPDGTAAATPPEVTTPPELRKPEGRPQRDRASREERRERQSERRKEARTEAPKVTEPLAPVTSERGERISRDNWRDQFERPDREALRDSRRFGDRTVIRLGDGRLVIDRGDDAGRRLRHNARDVETERLPGGRFRETVSRRDGSSVVTIYNRYGDIIRRSRILPSGKEIVIFFVPRDRWDSIPRWDRDPGYGLPPIVVNVPYDDYIWEPDGASSDDYYDFLYQPPIEAAERLYSVDEVRRSARLRQKLPRVDLSTVTFAFGSAEIREGDVGKLEDLANAIQRILEDNPSETFLIEGHTDAVGSDEANLALSDKRAESVAVALTDVFGLPPENLVTQGYGESDLKIATEGPSEENRRVTVRRITPLVTPQDAEVSQR